MREHGTRSRYQQGCRCDACRRANTEYQTRKPRINGPPHAGARNAWEPINGRLATVCWCGRKVMNVRVADLRAGLTYSCGKDECRREAS